MNMLQQVHGKLIASCQALPDEPLHGSHIMAAVARALEIGGAAGIRANSPEDIVAIKEAVDLPVVGLFKAGVPGFSLHITPTLAHARAVADAGADMVAVDATSRPHPDGDDGAGFIARLKAELDTPILADISTLEEGVAAAEAGADAVGTTLAGYTPYSRQLETWDTELLRDLVAAVDVPVIAEGRIWTPAEARQALDMGAYAVVVGSAITRPRLITERFVRALQTDSEASDHA